MRTKALNVAASCGVKLTQTVRVWPAATVPGAPPEVIWKPATVAQSMYIGSMLLEQLMMPMLLMCRSEPPELVIVKHRGPAVPPRHRSAKLMYVRLKVAWGPVVTATAAVGAAPAAHS